MTENLKNKLLPSALLIGCVLLAMDARAQTPACDQLKSALPARLPGDPRGYTLEAVPAGAPVPPGAKVIGTCSGGAYKVLFSRRVGAPASPVVASAVGPASAPVVMVRPAPRPAEVASAAPAPPPPRRETVAASSAGASAAAAVVTSAPVVAAPAADEASPGFIAQYWRWMLALILLPIVAWLWAWIAHRRLYDAKGLPRGPRL